MKYFLSCISPVYCLFICMYTYHLIYSFYFNPFAFNLPVYFVRRPGLPCMVEIHLYPYTFLSLCRWIGRSLWRWLVQFAPVERVAWEGAKPCSSVPLVHSIIHSFIGFGLLGRGSGGLVYWIGFYIGVDVVWFIQLGFPCYTWLYLLLSTFFVLQKEEGCSQNNHNWWQKASKHPKENRSQCHTCYWGGQHL